MRKFIRIIATLVCIFSVLYIIDTVYQEIVSIRMSNALSEQYSELKQEEETTESTTGVRDDWQDNTYDSMTVTTVPVTEEENTETTVVETELETEVEEEEREPLEILKAMKPLYYSNRHTVGWLKIEGTKIDNVVVQYTDNDFYLNHNFNKEKSQPGTLFVDYRCNIKDYPDLQSHNIIIYGHKQASGTMFGTLDYYKNNLEFYKEHPTFTFSDLYNEYTYKVVAMFVTKTKGDDVFDYQNYINLGMQGERNFVDWITNVKRRTQIMTPVSVQPNDYYLTLSTCSYEFSDARFVVIARRVREGESTDVEVEHAYESKYAYVG